MAIYFRHPVTGVYTAIKIPAIKGEVGHSGLHIGESEPTDGKEVWYNASDASHEEETAHRIESIRYAQNDYLGASHANVKDAMDANVEYVLENACDELNTLNYEGTHIMATNTFERQVKNAVLSGETLLNINRNTATDVVLDNATSNTYTCKLLHNMRQDKKYKLRVEVSGNTLDRFVSIVSRTSGSMVSASAFAEQANGVLYYDIPTDRGDIDTVLLSIQSVDTGTITLHSVAIVETEREDFPYFEGVLSVQAPVLTVTGKNLFDINNLSFSQKSSVEATIENDAITVECTASVVSATYINFGSFTFKKGITYSLSCAFEELNGGLARLRIFNSDGNATIITADSNLTFTPLYDFEGGISLYAYKAANSVKGMSVTYSSIQLEQGASVTPYEPYKSSTVSPTEEVNLKGVGGICDRLDLAATENNLTALIGTYVVTGDAPVFEWDATLLDSTMIGIYTRDDSQFTFAPAMAYEQANLIVSNVLSNDCNRALLSSITTNSIIRGNNYIGFVLKRDELTEETTAGVLKWLVDNNVYCQTPQVPVTKTVDLTSKPFAYENITHYMASGEKLAPTLNIDVPTNLSAMASEQHVMIAKQQDEIDALSLENESLKATQDEQVLTLMSKEFDTEYRLMLLELST